MAFDFNKSLIKVQGGRSYLPVSARLIWFREEHPDWGIETEPIELNHDKQFAVFRARIYNADGKLMAMGTKKEDIKGFGDYIEKAETGAVGRALALCGFGTQFSPDLDEVNNDRIVDSPYPVASNRYVGNARDNYSGGSTGSDARPSSSYRGQRSTAESDGRAAEVAPLSARVSTERSDSDISRQSRTAVETKPAIDDTAQGDSEAATKLQMTNSSSDSCVNCGKSLTKAQHDLSTRNYGEALCPNCQKEKSRPVAAG